MRFLASKKLIIPIAILVLVSMLGLFTSQVWVEAAPAAPSAPTIPGGLRGAASTIAGKTTDIATTVITITVILYTLRTILSGLLTITGFFLDNIFLWNVDLNPGTMPIVSAGWTILRDISNSIFILIILWIAFTIIFNLPENLGGKKLLVRVIIIAFLINFSLAMVSAVFGFSNALARPFRNALTKEGNSYKNVSDLIVTNSKIHAVINQTDQAGINDLKNYYNQQQQEQLRSVPAGSGGDVFGGDTLSYLGAPQEAKALPIIPVAAAVAACGVGALTGVPVPGIGTTCAAISTALQWALAIGSTLGAAAIIYNWQMILNLAIGNIFLIVTIFAFVVAGTVLIARLVAMVFLSILAPVAFLLHAMPGKYASKYWDMWVENVIKWAFYAPAFYFFFYISLLVLQKMSTGQKPLGSFTDSLPQMMILIIFLAFLWGAIKLSKVMGITVADSLTNWGKKAGWGALGFAGGLAKTGFKNLGSAALRTVAPTEGRIQRSLRAAAEIPGLRTITKLPAQEYLRRQEALKKEVKDQATKLSNLSKPEKIAAFRRAFLDKEVVAATQALGVDIKDLAPEEIGKALNASSTFGLQKDILRIRPDLITENNYKKMVPEAETEKLTLTQAKKKIIETIKPNEIPDMASEALDDVETRDLLIRNLGPEHWKQVARSKNQKLLGAMIRSLTPESTANLKDETYRFLASNAAQGLGLRLPSGAVKPQAILQEEREQVRINIAKEEVTDAEKSFTKTARSLEDATREQKRLTDAIEDLNNTLGRLSIIPGREKEAETIREVELPGARDRKTRLAARIPNLQTEQVETQKRLELAKQKLRNLQGLPPEEKATGGETEEEDIGGGEEGGGATP